MYLFVVLYIFNFISLISGCVALQLILSSGVSVVSGDVDVICTEAECEVT